MNKSFYVYIITNNLNTTFYIGVTSNLIKRIFEHKNELVDGFSKKYRLHKLVFYELLGDASLAISREKQLKRWHRDWKINLIKERNPIFDDLYCKIIK